MHALKVSSGYLIIAIIWFLFLNEATFSFLTQIISLEHFKTAPNIIFIVASAILLFYLLKKEHKKLHNYQCITDSIFDHTSTSMLICNVQGVIIKVNIAFAELISAAPYHLKESNFFSLLPASQHKDITSSFATIALNAEPIIITTTLCYELGTEINVNLQVRNVAHGNDSFLVINLTEQLSSNTALNDVVHSQSMFSNIFQSLPIGVEIIDIATGNSVDINRYYCNLLKCDKEQHLAKNFVANYSWIDSKELASIIKQLKKDNVIHDYFTKIMNNDGDELHVKINAVMLDIVDENLALVSILDKTKDTHLINSIAQVAQTIASKDTPDFYDNCVSQIASVFGANQAIIGLTDTENNLEMNVLSYWVEGTLAEKFTYSLINTPCEQVTKNTFCYFKNDVQKTFPKDYWFQENNIQSYLGIPLHNLKGDTIGALILLFNKPTDLNNYWIDILKIFAGKISSELKHKYLTKEIRRTEQQLNLYREQAPLAALEWDDEFKLISCNKATEKMLGYSLKELQQKDFITDLVPKDEQDKVFATCDKLAKDTGGKYCVNSLMTKNNTKILTEWHNSVIKNDDNTIVGIVSIVKNITKEKAQLSLLTYKEKTNREILNTIIDAVITITDKGIISTINNATLSMFGYEENELIGQNVSLLMPDMPAANHDQYIASFDTTKEAKIIGIGREVMALKKNNQEFPIRLTLAKLSADENNNLRYVGTCHDLTQIKQQQKTLARVQKMDALGKLTGGISHDFNNILGVILGFSELLESELAQHPKLAGFCAQIIMASERGSNLTRKLLSFSKQQSHLLEVVNINDLIYDMENMLTKSLTASINIELKLTDDLWINKLDKNAFDDAILNLCINAKHAMPHGGLLTIKTSNKVLSEVEADKLHLAVGEYVVLTLKDNGCGMSSEVQSHLFEPFYTTKGDKGTGLGLPQVYGFIKSSFGAIHVFSEIDIGSTMTIYLPKYRGAAINKSNTLNTSPANCAGNETILVVDDEPALSLLAKTILVNEGYTVIQADCAIDALVHLNEQKIDLLLSDIIMPKTNGYQLVTKARALGIDIPILFVSGYEGENKIIDSNMKNVPLIHKPYNSNTLLLNIRKLLDGSKNSVVHPNKSIKSSTSAELDNIKQHKTNELHSEKNDSIFNIDNAQLKQLFAKFVTIAQQKTTLTNIPVLQQQLFSMLTNHFIHENKVMLAANYTYQKNHDLVHKLLLKQLTQAIETKTHEEFSFWINAIFFKDYQQHSMFMDATLNQFILAQRTQTNSLLVD